MKSKKNTIIAEQMYMRENKKRVESNEVRGDGWFLAQIDFSFYVPV